MECPRCEKTTEHTHRHYAVHGIPGTHMAGSEHYECVECGYTMYKNEGERQGLKYIFGAEKSPWEFT